MSASVASPIEVAPQVYRTAEVARLLGVTPARVRAIVRAGLCRPTRAGRALRFTFQDLVLLRTAHGLLQVRVPPRRVRRALAELTKQLPTERPLSGVRIYADGRNVVVRQGRTLWRPESGQIVFSFEVDDLARAAGAVVPVRERPRPSPAAPLAAPWDAGDWFDRALECEQERDTAAARTAYHRALELDPELSDAYINLGRLAHQQSDVSEAARLYHLALACEPDDPIAHYNLAIALEDQSNLTAAVSHYERAIGIDARFADAHFNLGRLLDRLGRRTQAMRHLLLYRKLTATKKS